MHKYKTQNVCIVMLYKSIFSVKVILHRNSFTNAYISVLCRRGDAL